MPSVSSAASEAAARRQATDARIESVAFQTLHDRTVLDEVAHLSNSWWRLIGCLRRRLNGLVGLRFNRWG
jgi:hypothetical protein